MMKLLPYFLFLMSLTALAQENQSINWDEATINNKLTLTISKRDFEAIYKKDYIVRSPTEDETCGTADEASVKMLDFKDVSFEVDNNILNFRNIVFSKNNKGFFLAYKNSRFDERMTLDTFKKLFANAVALSAENTTVIANQIILAVPDSQNADDSWEFVFVNNNLKSIRYNFSCE